MTTTTAPRTFRAIDLLSMDRSAYPERITTASAEVAPFMLHVTFNADNSISRASVFAWRVRSDGRADVERETTVAVDVDADWVKRIAYTSAPVPTAPGRYARYPERNMIYPLFFSLSTHGVWYGADGVMEVEDVPASLIAR